MAAAGEGLANTPKLCCPDKSETEALASASELPEDVLSQIVALLPQKQRQACSTS